MSDTGTNPTPSAPSDAGVKVGTGLLVAGWIFSILGGIIGIAIAASIAFGKKYDEASRGKGKIMLIAAVVIFIAYMVIRASIQ